MPKDRTRGKAGHSAGAKRDKAIRAARKEVEKRQRQLAGAMADLAALEARRAGQETVPEPVVPTDEPGAAGTDDAASRSADVEPAGSGRPIADLEPATAETPDAGEAPESADAADGREAAEASEASDAADGPGASESSGAADSSESTDSALIG